jgi:ribosomal protein S18 acetylase RimI-like enzyme
MSGSRELLRRADGVVLCVVDGTDPVMRAVADLCYETLHKPFGVSRNDHWNETDPASTHIVALDEGRLVGYVRVIVEAGGAHLRQVVVSPGYRRRGIAASLVMCALARASELGVPSAFLNARANAVGIYERLGFRVVGGPFRMGRTYVKHVRMERPLSAP